jgi:broad specificity phosphatase PhoE
MGEHRRVWLVRHGNRLDFVRPEWFETAIHPYDPPLCPAGLLQAKELGTRLRCEGIDHVFVSPFLRTLQTAAAIAPSFPLKKLSLKIEGGLGEWLNPAWMPAAPSLSFDPTLDNGDFQNHCSVDRDYRSQCQPVYPESESQMLQRSAATMNYLVERYSGNLLVVAHKESLRGCAIALTGAEPAFSFDVCSITGLQHQGDRWQYILTNDSSHLSDPGVKVAP